MESAAGKEYIYHPINSSNGEIRLITIKSGCEPEPVECFLTHVSLGDKPQYEALSYVWGDPNVRSQMILEGCNFSVTSNLGTALSYLRLPDTSRTMWIDAICIDQSNIAERESQVQLMRNIYQEAEQVVSWMGAAETEDVAINTAFLLWEGQENNFSTAWLRGALSGGARCIVGILSITQFCITQHEYWDRIWITQEVALARKGVVKWKEMEIPYKCFVEFSRTFSEVTKDTQWVYRRLELKDAYLVKELSQMLERNDIIRRIAPGTPLLDLLQQNERKKATDPRDKVYALLGLSDMPPNSHEGLKINYGEIWSKRDVYTGVVRAVVHKTSRLDIICEARPYASVLDSKPRPEDQEIDVPSWAPDWTAAVPKPLSTRIDSRIGAAGLVPANVEFYDDKNVMKAQGICTGTVGARGRCLPKGIMGTDPKGIILCRVIVHEWLELYRSFAGGSVDIPDAFCKTISFGLQHAPNLVDLLAEANQSSDSDNPPSSLATVYFPLLQKHMRECGFFIIESIKDHSFPDADLPLLCGIGPEEVQEKDKICILAGCKYPVALRPDGNRYRFVSPVFVDDLWDGQAIEGVEAGRYSWDWFEMH